MAQNQNQNQNQTLSLRAFQETELQRFGSAKKFGIVWDMGLGKTPAAASLIGKNKLRRVLIICPDNAFAVWSKMAPEWIRSFRPEVNVKVSFVQGEPWNRDLDWNDQGFVADNELKILICTPDVFIRDWGKNIKVKSKKFTKFFPRKQHYIPDMVIFDEAKRMRNPESTAFKLVSRYLTYYNVQWFLPLTGTPGHEPKHFWTMLNCINPKLFGSYWQFLYKYHEVEQGYFGLEVGEPKNLEQWHQVLGAHFSVVKEDDPGISDQRPPITRVLLPIEMDPDQKALYDDLYKEMLHYVEQDDSVIIAQNTLTLATRLRQSLICPAILSPALGIGAAIKDFVKTVEPGEHVVIFTPFTSAIPFFYRYLESKGFAHVYTLQGGMGTQEREVRLEEFRKNYGVIICSTLYAQAFSLEPATRSFAIGYDWDPDNNRQAEKRLHRLTTQNPITSYYYTMRSTFDERLCEILNIKQEHVNMTIPRNLRELLRESDHKDHPDEIQRNLVQERINSGYYDKGRDPDDKYG